MMWLAHHFPGLSLTIERLDAMTPEETQALVKAGRKILKARSDEWLGHTRVIAAAAGARVF